MIGVFLTKLVCRLHDQHKKRMRRYKREDRRRRAAREREQGWQDLFDHMSRRAARNPQLASQPVALTAKEAAHEAKRGEVNVLSEEEAIEAHGAFPLARPPRKRDR